MKKHVVILSIVVLGGIFAVVALLSQNGEVQGPKSDEETWDKSTLSRRIEAIGSAPYSKEEYLALLSEINGLSGATEINSAEADSYRNTLENERQSALCLSFKDLRNSCYSNKASELLQASKEIKDLGHELSNALGTELSTYQQYKKALSYEGQLAIFLASPFNEGKASAIVNGYKVLISGKPFFQCQKIQALDAKLSQEVREFRSFYIDYEYKILKKSTPEIEWYDVDLHPDKYRTLKRYKFYSNEIDKLNQ
jgi:hypothetical protein